MTTFVTVRRHCVKLSISNELWHVTIVGGLLSSNTHKMMALLQQNCKVQCCIVWKEGNETFAMQDFAATFASRPVYQLKFGKKELTAVRKAAATHRELLHNWSSWQTHFRLVWGSYNVSLSTSWKCLRPCLTTVQQLCEMFPQIHVFKNKPLSIKVWSTCNTTTLHHKSDSHKSSLLFIWQLTLALQLKMQQGPVLLHVTPWSSRSFKLNCGLAFSCNNIDGFNSDLVRLTEDDVKNVHNPTIWNHA